MPVFRYENLSHSDLTSLPRAKTVMFIPSGPLEQHGPHLPLGVDAFSAEYFSVQMAERLSNARPDWNFVILPTIFAGCDTLTYPGTIEVRPWILYNLLYDCCRQLAKDGFRTIIAVGAHGGPRHMVVLEEIAAKMRWRHRARMISASARIMFEILEGAFIEKISKQLEKNGDALSEAERVGLKHDYHGGLLETSLMLAAKPELVKPIYKELEPAILDRVWKMTRKSGKKVGQGLGHLGSPALARTAIGVAATEVILDDVSPLVERFIDGEDVYKLFRSKLYYVPFFRTHFKVVLSFLIFVTLLSVIVAVMSHYTMEMIK